MSVHICKPADIAILARTFVDLDGGRKLKNKNLRNTIMALAVCNADSVCSLYGYPNLDMTIKDFTSFSTLGEYVDECMRCAYKLGPNSDWLEKLKIPTLLGIIKYYEYQSCEHPGYQRSSAHFILSSIKNYIIAYADLSHDTWGISIEEFGRISS